MMRKKLLSIAAIFYATHVFSLPSDLLQTGEPTEQRSDHAFSASDSARLSQGGLADTSPLPPQTTPQGTAAFSLPLLDSFSPAVAFSGRTETAGQFGNGLNGVYRAPAFTRKATPEQLAHVALPPLSEEEKAALTDYRSGKPLLSDLIGIGRQIAAFSTHRVTKNSLRWKTAADGGQVAAVSISSSGAAGLRVGVALYEMPDAAIVKFYNQTSTESYSYTGRELLEIINRNINADGESTVARTFWAPALRGEQLTVEIEIPPGKSTSSVRFALPRISHLVYPGLKNESGGELRSDATNLDATCRKKLAPLVSASPRLVFVIDNGNTWPCSGTLLNSPSKLPYLATATHCVPSQTIASTIQSDWNFSSDQCNTDQPSSNQYSLSGGMTLLYTQGDFAFLRMNEAPPYGAHYAGWTDAAPGVGYPAVLIHHPMGDFTKVTFAQTGTRPDLRWDAVNQWSSIFDPKGGSMEVGSSGSGLWIYAMSDTSKRNPYFVGTAQQVDALPGTAASHSPLSSSISQVRRWLLSAFGGITVDLDRDSRTDVVLSAPGQHLAVEMLGDARRVARMFAIKGDLLPRESAIQAVGDFDGDGDSDYLIPNPAGSSFTVINTWRDRASDSIDVMSSGTIPGPGFDALPYNIGDLDGDARADILWVGADGKQAAISLMRGLSKPKVLPLTSSLDGWRPASALAAAGLFDKRGYPYVLVQKTVENRTQQRLLSFVNDLRSPLWIELDDVPEGFETIGVGDFDGDGQADLLYSESTGGVSSHAVVALNKGWDPSRESHLQLALNTLAQTIPEGWHILKPGDFNGDGVSDILLYDTATRALQVWTIDASTLAATVGPILPALPDGSWRIF